MSKLHPARFAGVKSTLTWGIAGIFLAGFMPSSRRLHAEPLNQIGLWAKTTPVLLAQAQTTTALVQHLDASGVKMYGAYWCPYCKRQKKLFGKAFQGVTYIECDPKGKNPQTQRCRNVGIKAYPTWEIQGKLYPGLRSLHDLAVLSGYPNPQVFEANP